MKTISFAIIMATTALIACTTTQKPEEKVVKDEPTAETNPIENSVWPDSLTLTPAGVQECYYDNVIADYIADTGCFQHEETRIAESHRCFVASYIQPLKMPKEWKNNKQLSDMVNYYNYMAIMHAIETDYDAYERYTSVPGDFTEEQQKEIDKANSEYKKDFYAELDRINPGALSNRNLQNSIRGFIRRLKDLENGVEENHDENQHENIWDISETVNELTDSWVPDIDQVDSVEYSRWLEMSSPQYYLPGWIPDVFERFLGQNAKPDLDDKMNIFWCFNNTENFNEKAALGFVVLGVHSYAPCIGLLSDVEEMLASGNYSPMLDPLWRAYRVKYNDSYSCPSTWCYSPNVRYNHFRRLIAYTTLRHIEAHPEDEFARLQYYYMVMHTDILRLNHPYPYGNSSATEAILLYWNPMLLYY